MRATCDGGVFADQWEKEWITSNALGTLDNPFQTIWNV